MAPTIQTISQVLNEAHTLYARSGIGASPDDRPASYKVIGICLAVASGLFIGVSFIFSKKGLLKANEKYSEVPGEGYGYLKNAWWWGGMTLMVIGEICNFIAYAFTDAILVASLGALSVVISTVLSAIFLKERLSAVGIVGCVLCILGAVNISLNIPSSSAVKDIQDMQQYVLKPGILVYGGIVILSSVFLAVWAGPRYGNKNVMVYLSICSLVGGLSVVATQGLGSAILAQIGGKPQFNTWFIYVLLAFVIVTLVVEILYLNKALNIFNAALVTPTYYVAFTSATIITSAILFRGFKGTPTQIITVVMSFLTICAGVVLLQLSKSAKDVPDAAVFSGDLNQLRTIAEQEQPESDPKADAIRGTASIVRRLSHARQKMELAEAKKLHEESHLQTLGEDEQVEYEWDGLRRRRTTLGSSHGRPSTLRALVRNPTLHPPLGMSYFPADQDDKLHAVHDNGRPSSARDSAFGGGFLGSLRTRARSMVPGSVRDSHGNLASPLPLHEMNTPAYESSTPRAITLHPDTAYYGASSTSDNERKSAYDSGLETIVSHDEEPRAFKGTFGNFGGISGLASSVAGGAGRAPSSAHLAAERPHQGAKRQFSFSNVFRRSHAHEEMATPEPNFHKQRLGLGSRSTSGSGHTKGATEEELHGLVEGDSASDVTRKFPEYEEEESYETPNPPKHVHEGGSRDPSRTASRDVTSGGVTRDPSPEEIGTGGGGGGGRIGTMKQKEQYERMKAKWEDGVRRGSPPLPPPAGKDKEGSGSGSDGRGGKPGYV